MNSTGSIPDPVFFAAERLARRMKKSRSQLYSEALEDYVARCAPEEVTERMDLVLLAVGNESDEFAGKAALRVLQRTEW
jgi:hypothetical protein